MPHRYLLFYKPYDVLCQFTNPEGLDCPTLKDFISVPGVYSVGRLDRDSEGLLLLTDDGPLKHRLINPTFAHRRTYWVQVERLPEAATLAQLGQGVTIRGGYRTRPAEVSLLPGPPDLPPRQPPIRVRKTVPTAWLSLTLTEGRNRQVRRMTAAVGHPTLRLVRVALDGAAPLGPQGRTGRADRPADRADGLLEPANLPGTVPLLSLGGLEPGQWRELSPQERQRLALLLRSPRSSSPSR